MPNRRGIEQPHRRTAKNKRQQRIFVLFSDSPILYRTGRQNSGQSCHFQAIPGFLPFLPAEGRCTGVARQILYPQKAPQLPDPCARTAARAAPAFSQRDKGQIQLHKIVDYPQYISIYLHSREYRSPLWPLHGTDPVLLYSAQRRRFYEQLCRWERFLYKEYFIKALYGFYKYFNRILQ